MKILKWLLISLVSIVALLICVALLLPNEYGISRSLTIKAPASKIFPYITTPKEWTKWSIWNQRDPHMQISYAGPASGNGATWEWKSETQGNGGMKFGNEILNQSIEYELHFEGMGKPSTGELLLTADGENTKITWTMRGNNEGNLMMKLMAPLMDKMVGPDFEAGLLNLKTLMEKN